MVKSKLKGLSLKDLDNLQMKEKNWRLKEIFVNEWRRRVFLYGEFFFLFGVIFVIVMVLFFITGVGDVDAKPNSVKGILNLEDCRTVQKEDKHIVEGKGSVYAMDIACDRGQSFEVKAPLWKDKYEVRYVGYDSRLGDYIILKHGEYQFVFGHTKSKLKKGDRIQPSDIIGTINKSGISENYHLHFELWKNDYNISYRAMLGEEVIWNMEYTYKLRKQRGWYLGEEEAIDFISDFEGYRRCAYHDGKQYSVGFGTKAKSASECLTKEQAKDRIYGKVSHLMEEVYKKHRVDYHNQRMALVSAMYNLGEGSTITEVKNRKTPNGIMSYFKSFNKANGKELRGLTKRRELEGKLYLNKL